MPPELNDAGSRRIPRLATWALAVAALGVLAAWNNGVATLAFAIALSCAIWRWPDVLLSAALVVLLVGRPALDMYSERRLGLGPFAISPAVVFGAGVLWVALVVGVRRARDGKRFWPDPALLRLHGWLLATYVIGLVAGLRWYGMTGAATGVREAARLFSVIGVFLLVLWWVEGRPDRGRRGWVYLTIGAVTPIVVAIWQWITVSGNLELEGINRLQGTFGHPHTFGPYLVPFILLAVAQATQPGLTRRLTLLTVAGGLTVLLGLTYSRTAELVLLTGLVLYLLLQAGQLDPRAVVRSAVAVLLFAALGWAVVGNAVRERFSGIRIGSEAIEAARTGQTENSFEWRLLNWGGLIVVGTEHPYTGHGMGMTAVLNPQRDPATDLPYTAHDDFVRVFFETGAVGLVCYIVYGILLSMWALRAARAVPAAEGSGALGVVAAFIALFFLTAGTPEFGTQTAVQYEVYTMLGLMTASKRTGAPSADRRREAAATKAA